MKTKYIYLGIVVVATILVLSFLIGDTNQQEVKQPSEQNYLGMAMLGVYPNAPSRLPKDKDVYTGVSQGNILLYESHSFEKGDYGRTFLVRGN